MGIGEILAKGCKITSLIQQLYKIHMRGVENLERLFKGTKINKIILKSNPVIPHVFELQDIYKSSRIERFATKAIFFFLLNDYIYLM